MLSTTLGLVAFLSALSPLGSTAGAGADENLPPNILIVLIDDVGTDMLAVFDELNPYRSDLPYEHGVIGAGDAPGNGPGTSNLYVHAPTITALAEGGVAFLNAYTHPRCSPTRASLISGLYPARHGVGNLIFTGPAHGGALREFGDPGFESPTLPMRLRDAGYSDAFVGKFHLALGRADMDPTWGSDDNMGWAGIPERAGWSTWRSVFSGLTLPPIPPFLNWGYYSFYWCRDKLEQADVLADPDGYQTTFATTVEVDETIDWIAGAKEPFLCLLATNSAHAPWKNLPPLELVTTDEYLEPLDNAFLLYAANVESLDAELGRLLASIEPEKLARTVVVFMGDNGMPETPLDHARTDGVVSGGGQGSAKDLGATYDFLLDSPLPRFKSSPYEKGTRVPMIVAGPGIVAPGRTSMALVQVEDVLATVLELAGLPGDESLDGISFVPVLRDMADYATHARDTIWTELFTPTGLVEPRRDHVVRHIGCSVLIPGLGRFKIVRDPVRSTDRFYQLQDAEGAFVDPFETEELSYAPGAPHRAAYELVSARIGSILAGAAEVGPPLEDWWAVLCSCDGHAVPAPCGNLGHTGRGCASSQRPLGSMLRAGGSPSLAAADLVLKGHQLLPNLPALFFQGTQTPGGGVGLPFGDGVHCAGGSVIRLQTTATGPAGTLQSTIDVGAVGLVQPGDTRIYQLWYRDPAGPCGSGFNLTNGLRVTFEL